MIDRVLAADPDAGGLRGEYLAASFDFDAGSDEVHFTRGDSGAPVFLSDCGVWKLAAVASAVDGPFVPAEAPDSEPFLAALFDARGFAVDEGSGTPRPVEDPGRPAPTSWYAARISPRAAELRAIAGLPSLARAASPPDQWVWRQTGTFQDIALRAALPEVDGGNAAVGQEDVSGEVVCVETVSAAGARLDWRGAEVRYTASAEAVGESVDSFRYVTEAAEGQARAWGRVIIVSPSLAQLQPRVVLDREGAVVVVWPAASAGVATAGVPRVERAPEAGGPWQPLEAVVSRLDGWYVFAGRPVSTRATSECFRLVFE